MVENTVQKSNRVAYLDAVKAFTMFLVILAHLIQFAVDYDNDGEWKTDSLLLFIYSFHMPLFFFVSGIFLDDRRKLIGGGKVFIRKLQQLMIPNWVWNVFCLVLSFQIYGFQYGHHFWQDVIYMVFIQGHYWFLPSLFCCYIVCWLALRVIPNNWCAAFISCLLMIIILPGGYKSFNIATFLPFFWGGYMMKKMLLSEKSIKATIALLTMYVLAFLLLFKEFNYSHTIYSTPLDFRTILSAPSNLFIACYRWLIGFCGAISIVLIFKLFYEKIQIPYVSKIGMFTLGAYLIHMPIMDILNQCRPLPERLGAWNDYMILPVTAILLQCLLAIVQKYISKNAYAGFLLFGKPLIKTLKE